MEEVFARDELPASVQQALWVGTPFHHYKRVLFDMVHDKCVGWVRVYMHNVCACGHVLALCAVYCEQTVLSAENHKKTFHFVLQKYFVCLIGKIRLPYLCPFSFCSPPLLGNIGFHHALLRTSQ